MLGWLAFLGAGRRASSPVSTCWRQIAPGALLPWLPQLGCVLYQPPRSEMTPTDWLPAGTLAQSRELAPLLSAHWVQLSCSVGHDGPREWIDCIGPHGHANARIYLLPDTDYLAWDGMLAQGTPVDDPRRSQRLPVALADGRLTCFSRRQWAGLAILASRGPGPLSCLGREVAREIVRSDALARR